MENRLTLEQVYEAYHKMKWCIFRQGIPYLPPWMDIEDLWQDILLDGLKRVPELYRPDLAELTTYVTYRGIYFLRNFRTKRSRRKISFLPLSLDYEPEGEEPLNVPDYKKMLFQMSAILKPNLRIVVRCKCNGMTDDAIGIRLGVSRQRVDQLFHKAIAEIQSQYSKQEIEKLEEESMF